MMTKMAKMIWDGSVQGTDTFINMPEVVDYLTGHWTAIEAVMNTPPPAALMAMGPMGQ